MQGPDQQKVLEASSEQLDRLRHFKNNFDL